MAKRRLMLIMDSPPFKRPAKWRPLPADVKVIKRVEGKAQRAAAKVARDAYTFAPDDMIAIALDYKNQRIMVKQVTGDPLPYDVARRFEALARSSMILGRMNRGWGLGRDCSHPRMRRKKKRYCVGTDQGEMSYRMAEFCTSCGTILSHVDEEFKVTLGEAIAAKVASYPVMHRVRPMIETLKAKYNKGRK